MLDRQALRGMFGAHVDIMARTIFLLGGFAWFTNEGARFGEYYEREELARTLLDHLGFRRMTKGAKAAIKSAFNAAIRRELLERVDAVRVRRR